MELFYSYRVVKVDFVMQYIEREVWSLDIGYRKSSGCTWTDC